MRERKESTSCRDETSDAADVMTYCGKRIASLPVVSVTSLSFSSLNFIDVEDLTNRTKRRGSESGLYWDSR